ncbi:Glycine betaine transport ATP-binding protein OpuAA [Streptomyces sp. MBT84]|nr:Glycine betaine transport ATP-binding protein OpuAA [Streptomyces sp. MBT84]
MSSRLEAEHLYKAFGRRPDEAVERLRQGADREELRADGTTAAVIDASFTVDPGQIFVVMGLSGSGKSTLLRMLNGLLEPTAGQVLFDGQDLTALGPRELREVRSRKISMVFQHFALFPHRSVRENAAYGLEVQGVPAPSAPRVPTRRSPCVAWPAGRSPGPTSCPAACSSVWAWPARSPRTPTCC